MIIVTYEDYEYTDIIGVFDTLDRALVFFKEKNYKPQDYIFQTIISENVFEAVENVPSWCADSSCLDESFGLKLHGYWNRLYCSIHYYEKDKERIEQEKRRELRIEKNKLEAERRRVERITFEKKWDIQGHWYATFIHDGGNEDEVRDKVDHWKKGNWVSGSVYAGVTHEDELGTEMVGEGVAPMFLPLHIIKRRVEPRKENKEDV